MLDEEWGDLGPNPHSVGELTLKAKASHSLLASQGLPDKIVDRIQ